MTADVRTEDGCRLWTDRVGAGAPLVLCHGGPGIWDYLGPVARLLDGHARAVRWDQRGCGRSQRRGPYTIGRFVADLDAVREHLAGPRTAVLGHSWGAHLALRYAIEHPERVSRLIYVSGTGIGPERGWHPHYERNLRRRLGPHLNRWEALGARTLTPAEELRAGQPPRIRSPAVGRESARLPSGGGHLPRCDGVSPRPRLRGKPSVAVCRGDRYLRLPRSRRRDG
ncbi:alpha/beta fold hydrolase [Micromonospora tulbaghiae]|uniref:alpha/beta hydrolase n=1 Tax=Micromonospora TaxID=1873 RepID=UPI00207C89DA|nr:alpha/beta fold hydrolase [Micromonospora sp. CPM1]MCO1618804.1 alpha/beta fold hydrolase [Micromonospora sp. CPM1]